MVVVMTADLLNAELKNVWAERVYQGVCVRTAFDGVAVPEQTPEAHGSRMI
jgi:hypothetical protein